MSSYLLLSLFGNLFIKFLISVSVHGVRNTLSDCKGILCKYVLMWVLLFPPLRAVCFPILEKHFPSSLVILSASVTLILSIFK